MKPVVAVDIFVYAVFDLVDEEVVGLEINEIS